MGRAVAFVAFTDTATCVKTQIHTHSTNSQTHSTLLSVVIVINNS